MSINVAQRDLPDRLAFLAKGISRGRPIVLVAAHPGGRVELTADHGDPFAHAAIEAAIVKPGPSPKDWRQVAVIMPVVPK